MTMAKDYFQDITPPHGDSDDHSFDSSPHSSSRPESAPEPSERGIRNIQVSSTRSRGGFGGEREHIPPPPKKGGSRFWLWTAIGFAILLLGAIALVALRPTSVTVIPRTHTVLFDETAIFTAYPSSSGATGTLTFTNENAVFEDSKIVPSEGVENVSERASGTITVYNTYSTESVRLLANTRFEGPGGLIYRVPAEVMVPGKRGTTPGQIDVTVFAGQPGETYNIGPVEKFTLPGLKSTAAMYAGVYAKSTAPMTGGFVGERAAAPAGAVEGARAELRARLQERIREMASTKTDASHFAFADLARVTFESLPHTTESGGVKIAERARVEMPVFPADQFANTIGESVSAGAEEGGIILKPDSAFSARPQSTATSTSAAAPIQFSLDGTAQLIWKVDTALLSEALLGRDEAAFQAIVEGFPGIEEAHARIEPFWSNTFPTDASTLKIRVEEPEFAE
jgi:hypothetical protein